MISEFLVTELKVGLGNYQEEMKKREKEGQQGAEHLERKTGGSMYVLHQLAIVGYFSFRPTRQCML
jgi:hypothetical protein